MELQSLIEHCSWEMRTHTHSTTNFMSFKVTRLWRKTSTYSLSNSFFVPTRVKKEVENVLIKDIYVSAISYTIKLRK